MQFIQNIPRLFLLGYGYVFKSSARELRPRSVTIGIVLGALGWFMPMAHVAFFNYLWWSFSLIFKPLPADLPAGAIPPGVQAYFALVLLVWAMFPFFLLMFTSQGRNWAKWIFISYSVFNRSDYFWATYAELKSHHAWPDIRYAFFVGQNFNFLLQSILLTASIVLLSLPAAGRWFRAEAMPPDRRRLVR